ncbi:hypothetical protein [Maridesulfovibrio ferrireducens]|uniref:hypothetical protein n=1 Tax=Maridesulfovibrio ferrireducens TaxID=246191 RepID=UPI001A1B3EE6|nr:hypothetical protein [Maridesulfovibrio ferrireducens]MBI9110112.1 hypothetical protein [Maridesulfovibrio ferrireducens]
MATTYLNIKGDRLKAIADDFAVTQKQIDLACKRAISKLARHLKTIALRNISELTGIKQTVIRRRVFLSLNGQRQTARIWFGVYAIPLREMNPRQTRTGVRAGKIERNHAFIQQKNGGPEVYRRVDDRRKPIAIQYARIESEVSSVIDADVLKAFDKKFYVFFEREIKWESSK